MTVSGELLGIKGRGCTHDVEGCNILYGRRSISFPHVSYYIVLHFKRNETVVVMYRERNSVLLCEINSIQFSKSDCTDPMDDKV